MRLRHYSIYPDPLYDSLRNRLSCTRFPALLSILTRCPHPHPSIAENGTALWNQSLDEYKVDCHPDPSPLLRSGHEWLLCYERLETMNFFYLRKLCIHISMIKVRTLTHFTIMSHFKVVRSHSSFIITSRTECIIEHSEIIHLRCRANVRSL